MKFSKEQTHIAIFNTLVRRNKMKKCRECGCQVYDSAADYLCDGGVNGTERAFLAKNHIEIGHTIETVASKSDKETRSKQ